MELIDHVLYDLHVGVMISMKNADINIKTNVEFYANINILSTKCSKSSPEVKYPLFK